MSKKIDYTQSPALAIINPAGAAPEPTPADDLTKPEGMKLNPEYIEKYIEKKTKRIQLVFQPSIYEAAKDRAAELHTSLNDYLHRLIKADLQNKPNTDNSK